jgi:predicted transcriptional regulator
MYQGLTPQQQKVLLALRSESEGIFTDKYKKKYNLSALSTTQRAIERLIHLGMIEKESGSYQFSDPFFKEWLKTL